MAHTIGGKAGNSYGLEQIKTLISYDLMSRAARHDFIQEFMRWFSQKCISKYKASEIVLLS